MREFLARILHFCTTSRYTQHLERENASLRAEKAALLDRLLTTAHIAPITPTNFHPVSKPKSRLLQSQFREKLEAIAGKVRSDA